MSVVSDSVQHHRRQPTRLPGPWDSPGKNTGVGCHFLLQCIKMKSEVKLLSCVPIFATPWTTAYQAPPSMGFSRQEYCAAHLVVLFSQARLALEEGLFVSFHSFIHSFFVCFSLSLQTFHVLLAIIRCYLF